MVERNGRVNGAGGPRRAEVRAAADHMLELIDEVRSSEEQKREVPLGSEAFVELALLVSTKARVVSRWADVQLQLAQSIPFGAEDVAIADVPPRPLERVLALWREAQIRLDLAPPGSVAASRAVEDIERLRNEFQSGFELRREPDDLEVELVAGD